MEQLGHTDPKLALRTYAKVIGDRRRRGRSEPFGRDPGPFTGH